MLSPRHGALSTSRTIGNGAAARLMISQRQVRRERLKSLSSMPVRRSHLRAQGEAD